MTFANGVGTATEYYGDETAATPTITAKNGATTWGTTTVTITKVTVAESISGNSGGLGAASESVNLASAPTAGSTLIVLVYADGNGTAPGAPTIGGNPITGSATSIANVGPATGYVEWAYWASASGTNTTVTATFGANESRIEVDVLALAGNNTAMPIAQSNTHTGTSTTPTAVLPGSPALGDLEIGFLGSSGNDGGVVTPPPTGWTNLENANGRGSGGYGVASYFTNSNGSTSQAFPVANSVAWATIALDLQ